MPARNSRKEYLENSYYHLYNRGVEKRIIFQDQQDYSVFLAYLKEYLTPKDLIGLNQVISSDTSTSSQKQKAASALIRNNFSEEIELLSFVLMPNHYHFLVKQKSANSIDSFINSLGTRYTMYFNRKNHRVGKLYQGPYKALLIKSEEQLLHLSRYIHLNPKGANLPSSLPEYLGQRQTGWVKTEQILSYFNRTDPKNSYQSFMNIPLEAEFIAPLSLDFTDD